MAGEVNQLEPNMVQVEEEVKTFEKKVAQDEKQLAARKEEASQHDSKIEELDEKSTKGKGLFTAMGDLIDRDELFTWEVQLEKEISNWFRKNLRVPLVQSSESNHYAKPRAISWFKDSAHDYIRRMNEMAKILESYQVEVERSERDF